jgi:hypothetical protein
MANTNVTCPISLSDSFFISAIWIRLFFCTKKATVETPSRPGPDVQAAYPADPEGGRPALAREPLCGVHAHPAPAHGAARRR